VSAEQAARARLDRETSGLLILPRSARADRAARALREGRVRKEYLTLVRGGWRNDKQHVSLPLKKSLTVPGSGASASTAREGSRKRFSGERRDSEFTLLSAELLTAGPSIRVHLTHLGFPIAGDDKYGDFELNRALAKQA